jgi:hypothetical protein
MKNSGSDNLALEKRLALIGAILGPILLYLVSFLREDAFGLIDYFWSIPAGAVTGFLMPNAWPDKKD